MNASTYLSFSLTAAQANAFGAETMLVAGAIDGARGMVMQQGRAGQ